MSSIFEYVKEQRTAYRSYTIEIADGYDFSQYQTLRTIELYHNSKFLTGNQDSLKRKKPSYNITKFRVNVATRDRHRHQGHHGIERICRRLRAVIQPG